MYSYEREEANMAGVKIKPVHHVDASRHTKREIIDIFHDKINIWHQIWGFLPGHSTLDILFHFFGKLFPTKSCIVVESIWVTGSHDIKYIINKKKNTHKTIHINLKITKI